VNYLVVRIGGCGSSLYPSLYFTNTDPGRFDYLFWNQTYASNGLFYLRGNEGAEIYYGHTEQVVVMSDISHSAGPLTFTVQADRVQGSVDYGPAGYWHGTVNPCR
jgi:hypothetical protein